MSDIVIRDDPTKGIELLHDRHDQRAVTSRIRRFETWCKENGIHWMDADLGDYRDDLQDSLSPTSTDAYLSTLRSKLKSVTKNNRFIQWLHSSLAESGMAFSEAELKIQAVIRQIENAADASNSRVRVVKKQDRVDDERVWLTPDQEEYYLDNIGAGKPEVLALRDRAVIATLMATGVRADELCNIRVSDLFQTYNGRSCLLVREGKGNKQRVVLYGDLLELITEYVKPWLESSIRVPDRHKYAFHGFWRDYSVLRLTPMSTGGIRKIVYSIEAPDGLNVSPHVFRRTYARKLYTIFGMKMEWIQKQMGHSNIRTTASYIGEPDVEMRTPTYPDGSDT